MITDNNKTIVDLTKREYNVERMLNNEEKQNLILWAKWLKEIKEKEICVIQVEDYMVKEKKTA